MGFQSIAGLTPVAIDTALMTDSVVTHEAIGQEIHLPIAPAAGSVRVDLLEQNDVGAVVLEDADDAIRSVAPVDATDTLVDVVGDDPDAHSPLAQSLHRRSRRKGTRRASASALRQVGVVTRHAGLGQGAVALGHRARVVHACVHLEPQRALSKLVLQLEEARWQR